MEKVFEIYIKTTPERLWQAITDPELRAKYTFGVGVSLGLDARLPLQSAPRTRPSRRHRDRRRRECGGRSPAPARADLPPALERRREARGHLASHMGNRAGRRLVPPHRHPRQLRDGANAELLWRLAMVLSGLKTLLETGETADDARLAALPEAPAGGVYVRTLAVFNNISLDGYFSGRDGDLGWAHGGGPDPEFDAFVADNAQGEVSSSSERKTYDLMAAVLADRDGGPEQPGGRRTDERHGQGGLLTIDDHGVLEQYPGGERRHCGGGAANEGRARPRHDDPG